MKKYLVLGILFILPITVYLFFASGVNNFSKLPVLTENVMELRAFQMHDGQHPTLNGKITILGFLGSELDSKKANIFNLAHKIYKKNYGFEEFQFVMLVTPDQSDMVTELQDQLKQIADPVNYHFAYGSVESMKLVFNTLNTSTSLDKLGGTDLVFIIDKEGSLRGRNDDEDVGVMFGYNAADYAEINNKLGDDVKVLLAEYRLALKKYKTEREI